MNNRRVTPDCIRELEVNEIFVFGSNLNGYHGGGSFLNNYSCNRR